MKTEKITPIQYITDWDKIGGIPAMIKHCEHIIEHKERYIDQRVFEAKTLIDNFKNKPNERK